VVRVQLPAEKTISLVFSIFFFYFDFAASHISRYALHAPDFFLIMSCFVLFLGFFESRAWQIFLITLVIFSAWICPFELAFLRQLPKNLYIADNIVNTFFAVDIVLTFFVAYLDKETYLLVDNPKRIAARYVPITYFV
jgi:Ion transport protein